MFKDYLPIISGLLSLFILVFLYDSIQSRLRRKTSLVNNQLSIALNIVVFLGIFALSVAMIYLILSLIEALYAGYQLFNFN